MVDFKSTMLMITLNVNGLNIPIKKPNLSDCIKMTMRDFPGGTVVRNPPADAGDTGLSPGPGRSHMPWSN